jgi:hypothetical protein
MVGSGNMNSATLTQVAKRLGMERGNCRKWLIKHGIKGKLKRVPETGNQLTLVFSAQQVSKIIRLRKQLGFKLPLEPVNLRPQGADLSAISDLLEQVGLPLESINDIKCQIQKQLKGE